MNLAKLLLVMASCFVTTSLWAETPAPQILAKIKVYQGDPNKPQEAKVLAQPILVTTVGRPLRMNAGEERDVPALLKDDLMKRSNEPVGAIRADTFDSSYLEAGKRFEFDPKAILGDKVRANVTFDVTEFAETADKDAKFAQASGQVVRQKGLYEFGKPYTTASKPDSKGICTWVEFKLELVVVLGETELPKGISISPAPAPVAIRSPTAVPPAVSGRRYLRRGFFR